MREIIIKDEDVAQFQNDGFWVGPKLLHDDQIERLKNAQERIWNSEQDGEGYPLNGWPVIKDPTKIRQFTNAFWINDEIKDVVTHQVIGEIASKLMDTDEVRLWNDHVVFKPGTGEDETSSGIVGWHQDYSQWQCSNTSNMITVWIALQDTDVHNGGMIFVPGSHKWGLVPGSDTFSVQNLEILKARFARNGREWNEVPIRLKAGQASFHHSLVFHCSGPNRSTEPRLSVLAHLIPKGTAYRAGVQFYPNIYLLGPRPYDGQLFDTQFFPKLFPSERE